MSVHGDPLDSVIGDGDRAKLLRLFVLNKDFVYTTDDFSKTLRGRQSSLRRMLLRLCNDGIVRRRKISLSDRKRRGTSKSVGYAFNKRYAHRDFLEEVVRISVPSEGDLLAKKIVRVSGVQYLIIADLFIEKPRKRVDLVVASSEDNESDITLLVQETEQKVGRELRCVFLTVNDLLHRTRVNDRFIRNILESDVYSVHLDTIGLS